MENNFSRHNELAVPLRARRTFEILPGLASWLLIAGLVVYSFVDARASLRFIIAFALYWLVRLLHMDALYLMNMKRLEEERPTDWMDRARGVSRLYQYWKELNYLSADVLTKQKTSLFIHREELRALEKSKTFAPPFEELYHLIIFTIESQRAIVYTSNLITLLEGKFPAERILIVLSASSTVSREAKMDMWDIQTKYKSRFMDILSVITSAPAAFGESAGATLAATTAVEYFHKRSIGLERVIVSRFSASVAFSPDFLGCLTYQYLVAPDRLAASFQAIPVYHPTFWSMSPLRRAMELGSSFFHFVEAAAGQKRASFLGESMSLKTLSALGYWPEDLRSERGAVFWKAFLHFKGKYRVVPLFVRLYHQPQSTQGQTPAYEHSLQWAWSAEHFSFLMRGFMNVRSIPFAKMLAALKLFESNLWQATWPFVVFIIGWLPLFIADRQFADITQLYTTSRIGATLATLLILIGINCLVLSVLLLPARRTRIGVLDTIKDFLLWPFLLPLSIFVNAARALAVQTRLFLQVKD